MGPLRKLATWRALAFILLLVGFGTLCCRSSSNDPQPADSGNNPEPVIDAHPVVGTWRTSGTHERLGEVEVVMTLEIDGTLRMVVELTNGGSLSFPGSWEIEDQALVLRGAYFANEVSTVSWALAESGSLILTDSTGSTQDWSPEEP